MTYQGKVISGFYLIDWDNLDDPQDMLKARPFYACPDAPQDHLSASQMRDLINIVAKVAGRIGGYAGRISWFAEIKETPALVEVADYNQLAD